MIDFLLKTAKKFSVFLFMHLFIFVETSTIPVLYVISVKSVQFKGILKLSFIINCLSLAKRDPCLSTLCNVNVFSPRKLIPELKVKQMGILKGKVISRPKSLVLEPKLCNFLWLFFSFCLFRTHSCVSVGINYIPIKY